MIATIIIVGLALAWLGYESAWLTIRLERKETIKEYDRRILAKMEAEAREEDARYQQWLNEIYEPKYTTKPMPSKLEPYQKHGAIIEDMASRRAGEMIYQRGK